MGMVCLHRLPAPAYFPGPGGADAALNKFDPLPDGELKAAIEAFAARVDFRLKGIFTMDGSKRSSKANAFFTGFGRFRRIVLFDTLSPANPKAEASRLLQKFANKAARGPVQPAALAKFEQLVNARLDRGESFPEAMLAGYQAILCSDLFLYLREPRDHHAIASRLSHFLTNTRPDEPLLRLAAANRLRDPRSEEHV